MKDKKNKPVYYGGQALMEGVMMQGNGGYSMAVRTADGKIVYKNGKRVTVADKHKIWRLPILRGLASFCSSMYFGMSSLAWSAFWAGEDEEETLSWKEIAIAIVLALIFSIGLFVVLPVFVANFSVQYIGHFGRSALEGCLRIAVFLLYVVLIRKMPDVARVFRYHGAEHKTISTNEAGDDLTPEAAAKYSTIHCRCGTSFIFMTLIIMIVVFTFIGNYGVLGRIATKIVVMPIVFGVSYEVFRLPLKFPNSKIVKVLITPGLWMQKLTTMEPDKQMLEVGITALMTVPGFPRASEFPLPDNVMSEEEYKAYLEEKKAAKEDKESAAQENNVENSDNDQVAAEDNNPQQEADNEDQEKVEDLTDQKNEAGKTENNDGKEAEG
jgi:uncharacterized protein YqhQ